MPYQNNISPAARMKGVNNSLKARVEKRNARLAQVKIMLDAGLSKAEIARRCGVHYETIRRDIAEIQHKPRRLNASITDAILQAARREIDGEITTLEAREAIDELIDLAIDLAKELSN
ncbi:MAG: hypothetical protein OXL96_21160 [Candidatus Poribacteria bacterium]|nr:hypothetical protein [Candidatus Poribacteria bacterium]